MIRASYLRRSAGLAIERSTSRALCGEQAFASLGLGIGPAILVHEPAVSVGTHHVDIGASGEIVRVARAHFQVDGHRGGFVNQVMAVAGAFRKRRAIACAQHRLATVFDERQLALKQIDELVLVAVPVALAGPAARRQRHQIGTEIAKPARLAQAPPGPCSTRCIKWWRITRTLTYQYRSDVDFGHALLPRSVLNI